VHAQDTPKNNPPRNDETSATSFDFSNWDRLLHEYVDADGHVAYDTLLRQDRATFKAYLAALAKAQPDAWPQTEQLAFWINAYNSVVVAGVLDGLSAESLLGRGKLFKLWKVEVAGKKRTPDEIEHKILRARFKEPRIHFSIVCASASCPKLRPEAYVAKRLEAQLTAQARAFINDPSRNKISRADHELHLSKIFDWFKKDFEPFGGVPAFLARYADDAATRHWLLSDTKFKIDYLDYDWTLNAQDKHRPDKAQHLGS